MKRKNEILILGGDERQRILSELFRKDGYSVLHITSGKEQINKETFRNYKVIVLPVPVSKDKITVYSDSGEKGLSLKSVFDLLSEENTVFGGGFSLLQKEFFEEENIEFYDILSSELFAIENAYFTAQGALRLLLENTKEYLKDKTALITGYGRIGSALGDVLLKIGMKVSVAARNEVQLKYAEKSGCLPLLLTEKRNMKKYDFVFNTVPSKVFTDEDIASMKDEAVYFELASAPFGAEAAVFEKFGKRRIPGASLPGVFLPVSSAELLKKYIEQRI